MGDTFSVDLNQVEDIMTRLAALSSYILDQLEALDNQVAGLSASWSGQAAAAHAAAHAQWVVGAKDFAHGVADMAAAAKSAHANYSASFDANTRMFRLR